MFHVFIWRCGDTTGEIQARGKSIRMLQNLSLDQAPPISVPFKFFAIAPVFGMMAGLLLLTTGPDLFASRWSPAALTFTHFFTLGFLNFIMCGALMQMLPVLAGAVIPKVSIVSSVVLALLLMGTISLTAGFFLSIPALFSIAVILLPAGYGLFLFATFFALKHRSASNDTVRAMHFALFALGITVLLGVILILFRTIPGVNRVVLTNIHLGWGLLGWTGLLVCGVAFQVVPMFQVTPRYQGYFRRILVPSLFLVIIVWSALLLMLDAGNGLASSIWTLFPIFGFVVFAGVTLNLQLRRKRKSPDVTRDFWMLGMISILLASVLWVTELLLPETVNYNSFAFLIGICMVSGFAVSVTTGMLYRIVPFLIWFHLQHQHITTAPSLPFSIPNVKKIIPMSRMKNQFRLHLFSILLMMLAALNAQWFAYPAGALIFVTFLILFHNLFTSMVLYRRYHAKLNELVQSKP